MGHETGVTTALRRTWIVGAVCLAVALVDFPLLHLGLVLVPEIGLLLLAVAAGTTAARGDAVGRAWFVLALAVPVLPLVAGLAVLAWLTEIDADPLALVLLLTIGGFAVLSVWAAFVIALVVDLARRRRRRFGVPPGAWNNDPSPPSYS
ncbi:hypothetical protein Q9S36_29705 [Microbacterium sp. ARD31]|uniref:hypothetical protein n=1 Tax=Microbacterium sp. ARD31 TaxID=2962576 RepID=UPI00288228CE|nr:hypothetical protein [Microbacterium sp. ARD31]MDT0184377.1 hypothetical protein [Microbacterium sp. ARD31]